MKIELSNLFDSNVPINQQNYNLLCKSFSFIAIYSHFCTMCICSQASSFGFSKITVHNSFDEFVRTGNFQIFVFNV